MTGDQEMEFLQLVRRKGLTQGGKRLLPFRRQGMGIEIELDTQIDGRRSGLVRRPKQLLPPLTRSKSPRALEDLPTACLQVSTSPDFQVVLSPGCLLLRSDGAQSLSEGANGQWPAPRPARPQPSAA